MQDMRVTIYPGVHHKIHSRPIHRIDHSVSANDTDEDHVYIGMQ